MFGEIEQDAKRFVTTATLLSMTSGQVVRLAGGVAGCRERQGVFPDLTGPSPMRSSFGLSSQCSRGIHL
jgi:hypothetical protein